MSPSVIDLTGDGTREILIADGDSCVYGWNASGQLLAGFPYSTLGPCNSGQPRTRSSLAIADLDQDGVLEVVLGTRGVSNTAGQRGKVFVLNALTGAAKWIKETEWSGAGVDISEVTSVALANVAGNSRLEVLAGTSNNNAAVSPNLYAWDAAGNPVSAAYPLAFRTAGIYGQIGAADLTGDGWAELVTGRDVVHMFAYNGDGSPLPNWPISTYFDPARATWGQDLYLEFTQNTPAMGDLNGDSLREVVIVGELNDPARPSGQKVIGSAVLVLKPNGERLNCWQAPPIGGPPLFGDFLPTMGPALADLNGDGRLDIVTTMSDGYVRAYGANGQRLWQYNFAQGQPLFASEPVIGDISGDGRVDIVFGTYAPDKSPAARAAVRLIALDAQGQMLSGFPVPLQPEANVTAVGIRAAPTLADVDNDGLVEIVATDWSGAVYLWDTTASYVSTHLPWPTGRQNNRRTGEAPAGSPPVTSAINPPGPQRLFLPLISTVGGCN
ncbi:MAG: VCBS repeat-containing protein [Anaerolineales bacterium]|nr:VCBS repeat-containing protein [Anaerolineales bacterium]